MAQLNQEPPLSLTDESLPAQPTNGRPTVRTYVESGRRAYFEFMKTYFGSVRIYFGSVRTYLGPVKISNP